LIIKTAESDKMGADIKKLKMRKKKIGAQTVENSTVSEWKNQNLLQNFKKQEFFFPKS